MKKFEDDFSADAFAEQATEIYKEVHELLPRYVHNFIIGFLVANQVCVWKKDISCLEFGFVSSQLVATSHLAFSRVNDSWLRIGGGGAKLSVKIFFRVEATSNNRTQPAIIY